VTGQRVSGRVVLITGAAAGIGQASARMLAHEGATIIATDINHDGARAIADEICARGGRALGLQHDAAREADWRSVIAATLDFASPLDVLVNNAGIGASKPLLETSLEDWHAVLRTNLDSVFLGCRHGIEAMRSTPGRKRAQSGSIINMSSVLGIVGFAEATAYGASKGGVRAMTKALALECAANHWDVRVNSIHPAFIWTPMNQGTVTRLAQQTGTDESTQRAMLDALQPMGRMGLADEVAALVAFLASNDSSFITGAELVIDGGYTAR